MITLLSPAKSLDYETKPATRKHTEPRLLAQSSELIDVLRELPASEIASLMLDPDTSLDEWLTW